MTAEGILIGALPSAGKTEFTRKLIEAAKARFRQHITLDNLIHELVRNIDTVKLQSDPQLSYSFDFLRAQAIALGQTRTQDLATEVNRKIRTIKRYTTREIRPEDIEGNIVLGIEPARVIDGYMHTEQYAFLKSEKEFLELAKAGFFKIHYNARGHWYGFPEVTGLSTIYLPEIANIRKRMVAGELPRIVFPCIYTDEKSTVAQLNIRDWGTGPGAVAERQNRIVRIHNEHEELSEMILAGVFDYVAANPKDNREWYLNKTIDDNVAKFLPIVFWEMLFNKDDADYRINPEAYFSYVLSQIGLSFVSPKGSMPVLFQETYDALIAGPQFISKKQIDSQMSIIESITAYEQDAALVLRPPLGPPGEEMGSISLLALATQWKNLAKTTGGGLIIQLGEDITIDHNGETKSVRSPKMTVELCPATGSLEEFIAHNVNLNWEDNSAVSTFCYDFGRKIVERKLEAIIVAPEFESQVPWLVREGKSKYEFDKEGYRPIGPYIVKYLLVASEFFKGKQAQRYKNLAKQKVIQIYEHFKSERLSDGDFTKISLPYLLSISHSLSLVKELQTGEVATFLDATLDEIINKLSEYKNITNEYERSSPNKPPAKLMLDYLVSAVDILCTLKQSQYAHIERFEKEVLRFSEVAIESIVRPTGSTSGLKILDKDTGKYTKEDPDRGYGEEPHLSRDQASAVVCFAKLYELTHDEKLFNMIRNVSNVYIALSESVIPKYDFKDPREFYGEDKSPIPYDSRAAVFAALGMDIFQRTITNQIPEKETCANFSKKILESLVGLDNYPDEAFVSFEEGYQGVIKHVCRDFNERNNIDCSFITADVVFLELLSNYAKEKQ